MLRKPIFLSVLLYTFLSIGSIKAQQNATSFFSELPTASVKQGEKLFATKCGKCHSICNQELGPPLTDITQKRPLPWLTAFIRNSSNLIAEGDPYAVHLYRAYNGMEMQDFEDLSNTDIESILAYINQASKDDRRDTLIEQSDDVSSLIESARNREYEKEKGSVDYYNKKVDAYIPVDGYSIKRGKGLFNSQCQRCHEICQSKIGPALAGISKRRPLSWLLAFIDNPKEVVRTNDNYSNFLISNYNFIMPAFEYLSEQEKLDILAYIRSASAGDVSTSGANSKTIPERAEPKKLNNIPGPDDNSGDKGIYQTEAEFPERVAFGILLILLFGTMAFFGFRYWKRRK